MTKSQPINLFTLPPQRVHIMGICGVGAAAIAWMLHLKGWRVSGCDRHIPPAMLKFFERNDIHVYQDHDTSHLTACDALVYSAAVSANEAELVMAREAGIPVLSRGECLAGWVSVLRSVAVCGTHGKTTTSCFTTRLLQCIGETPLWCLGGYTPRLHTNAGPIHAQALDLFSPDQIAVAEADESDGTLAYEHPAITVITNVDLDHLDHFKNAEEIEACFAAAVEHTREGVAVCADAPRAMRVATTFNNGPILTYGFNESAMLRAANLQRFADSTTATLWLNNELLGEIHLPIPGDHNVLNALGAMAAGLLLGFPKALLLANLPQACSELPKRRFQWMTSQVAPVRAIIDYAHHPAEILAMLSMAKLQNPKRLRIVFQPHRYSRTMKFLDDFVAALKGDQEVILLPVYAASEDVKSGCDSYALYAAMREASPDQRVLLARNPEEVLTYLRRSAQEGDLLMIVGAGDVERIGQHINNDPIQPATTNDAFTKLSATFTPDEVFLRANEPLARHSFYRAGGTADVYAEPKSIAALSALSIYCQKNQIPIQVFGAGSNTWFSDFGMPGVLCSLKGECFEQYHREGDYVTVGAGLSGAALLDKLEADGLSGLEFMHGIPGTVGGWARMNAGAHQHAVWEHITELRSVLSDGQLRHIPAEAITTGYRSVRGVTGMTLLSVTFRLHSGVAPETIHANRKAYAAKRTNFAGLHTCGSVFQNAENFLAGATLDKAGAKTWRIGGAFIAPMHANVIATDANCNGSDVLALMQKMRDTLFAVTQTNFIPEVRGF